LIDTGIASPCKRECILDVSSVCTSCFRSLDEIKQWGSASQLEKETIMENVIKRQRNEQSKETI